MTVSQMNNRITARKFLMINWSRFQKVTFEMSGSTLLTGVNGTGKSTILDAMSYLLTGNTKFNQAAKDKDRGVKAYVRGDTRANGSARYLRNGDQTSYLAMEFFNPIENIPLVIGVNIEYSSSSDTVTPKWFILKNHELKDVKWVEVNSDTGKFKVIPRSFLTVSSEKIKGTAFLSKGIGLEQVLRALGIRSGLKRYQSKLTKMMSFDPENNINNFIRESVLDEDPVTSLEEIRQYREQFAKMKEQYDDMLKERQQLEVIEEQSRLYEKQEQSLQIHELMLDYQDMEALKKESDDLLAKIKVARLRKGSLEKGLAAVTRRMNDAQDRLANARSSAVMQNFQGSINDLKYKRDSLKRDDQEEIRKCQDLEKLQKNIREICAWKSDVPQFQKEDTDIFQRLTSTDITAERKAGAFFRIRSEMEKSLEAMNTLYYHLNDKKNALNKEREDLFAKKKQLESNRMLYDARAEEARRIISKDLSARGLQTDVFLFAELVRDIKDPKWRKAIETFLGGKRFYIISEGKYVRDVMQIINDRNLYWAHAVVSDKLPDSLDHIEKDSAADQLVISNLYARRYANYLLNGIHLCKDLDELHEYPRGGLMQNGMLAKSYAVTKMDIRATRICLGKDAIEIQKKENEKAIVETNAEIAEIDKQTGPLAMHRKQAGDLNLREDAYDFSAPQNHQALLPQIASFEESIRQMEENPEFVAALQEQKNAEDAYNDALRRYTEHNSRIGQYQQAVEDMQRQRETLELRRQASRKVYQERLETRPEIENAMLEEYHKICDRTGDVIAIQKSTVERQQSRLSNEIIPRLRKLQEDYLRIANRPNDYDTLTGPSRIPFYREEYRKLRNVRIDEARQQLDEKTKQLESAFMNDFVAGLKEKMDNARSEMEGINRELRHTPFGNDTYRFEMKERSDRSAFFNICRLLDQYMDSPELMLSQEENNSKLDHDIQEFMNIILSDQDDDEYTDYRTYFNYDMRIDSRQGEDNIAAQLSQKQGSASGGEKQTPYFIILAASLMQCYPRDLCCERLAFIDEAFSALSRERIEQMVHYLEENHFQVIYAAPPEKISSIGSFIDTTVSLVTKGRYSFAIEGERV